MTTPSKRFALGLLTFNTYCKLPLGPTSIGQPFVNRTYWTTSFTLSSTLNLGGVGTPDIDLAKIMDTCQLNKTLNFDTGGKITAAFGVSKRKRTGNDPADCNDVTWTHDEAQKMLCLIGWDDPTEITDLDGACWEKSIQAIRQVGQAGVSPRP